MENPYKRGRSSSSGENDRSSSPTDNQTRKKRRLDFASGDGVNKTERDQLQLERTILTKLDVTSAQQSMQQNFLIKELDRQKEDLDKLFQKGNIKQDEKAKIEFSHREINSSIYIINEGLPIIKDAIAKIKSKNLSIDSHSMLDKLYTKFHNMQKDIRSTLEYNRNILNETHNRPTNTTEINQPPKDNITSPFQDTRDTLQHKDLPKGTDLISGIDLITAINRVEHFKTVIEHSSEDTKQYFTTKKTGAALQALYLGVKPAIFDLTDEIRWDIGFKPSYRNIYGDIQNDDAAYRKFLTEAVQPIYQEITNHIRQTNTSNDIRFIDPTSPRDYLDENDPIHHEYGVVLAIGDHAIYSNSSVKKLFNDHPNIFPPDNSDETIRSLISEHMPDKSTEDQKSIGLLCGYPHHAVEEYCQPTPSEHKSKATHLLGREYNSKSREIRNNIIHKKEELLYHLSGMGDLIKPFTRNSAEYPELHSDPEETDSELHSNPEETDSESDHTANSHHHTDRTHSD